jgi:hypothetical protein
MTTMRKLRLLLTLLILALSLGLLIWGLLPPGTENAVVPLGPADLQLPTPIGNLPAVLWSLT